MTSLKTTLSALIIAMTLSSASQAAVFKQECKPGDVTIPCAGPAWDFGAEVIGLQPSSGVNSIYAQSYTETDTGALYERHDFDPDYGIGWRVEGSYHTNTGRDVTLNWTHFNDDTDIHDTASDFTALSPYFASIFFDDVVATANVEFDAVNLEFGQLAHYGKSYRLRTHVGLQFARLESSVTEDVLTDTDLFLFTSDVVHYSSESEFLGGGLRAGLDTGYDLGNGFSWEGNIAVALLVGSVDDDNHLDILGLNLIAPGHVNRGGAIFSPSIYHTWQGSRDAIVPGIDAQAGLKYTTDFANGHVMLSLGWRIADYFNAIDSAVEAVAFDQIFVTNHEETLHRGIPILGTGVATETQIHSHDFALNGPFFGVKWVG